LIPEGVTTGWLTFNAEEGDTVTGLEGELEIDAVGDRVGWLEGEVVEGALEEGA
jgi:hypothetical protein